MELHNLNLLEWQQLAYKKILNELNNTGNYLSIYELKSAHDFLSCLHNTITHMPCPQGASILKDKL